MRTATAARGVAQQVTWQFAPAAAQQRRHFRSRRTTGARSLQQHGQSQGESHALYETTADVPGKRGESKSTSRGRCSGSRNWSRFFRRCAEGAFVQRAQTQCNFMYINMCSHICMVFRMITGKTTRNVNVDYLQPQCLIYIYVIAGRVNTNANVSTLTPKKTTD